MYYVLVISILGATLPGIMIRCAYVHFVAKLGGVLHVLLLWCIDSRTVDLFKYMGRDASHSTYMHGMYVAYVRTYVPTNGPKLFNTVIDN